MTKSAVSALREKEAVSAGIVVLDILVRKDSSEIPHSLVDGQGDSKGFLFYLFFSQSFLSAL